jgi:primase-polymerase (primpol)-like protein
MLQKDKLPQELRNLQNYVNWRLEKDKRNSH